MLPTRVAPNSGPARLDLCLPDCFLLLRCGYPLRVYPSMTYSYNMELINNISISFTGI